MTVHVLPCGVSILLNLAAGDRERVLTPAQLRRVQGWAETQLRPDEPADRWRASFEASIGPYLPKIRAAQQPRRLSAEVASLDWHATTSGPLDPDDLIVLLASDTWRGLLAALLNAARLDRGVRVHTQPELDAAANGEMLLDGGAGEPVHVLRIPGLRPDTTTGFTTAMQHVAKSMVWAGLVRRAVGEPFVLHLVGGYKATLPYLVVLAEYLNAVRTPLDVVCLHEGDPAAQQTPEPVKIQLRRVQWQEDLAILDAAARGQRPDNDRLLGFAYTDNYGRAELTDLGQVLASIRHYLQTVA